ncbi:MAG: glycosyltransferase family 2 protein [Verrucomicrobiota bacterium]
MLNSPPSLSVLVPVYRCEASLNRLTERLLAVLHATRRPFEIIFINDGSPDQSWAIIQDWVRRESRIRGINLLRNFGQHNALLCGIRYARHDVIVTLDADLQNPPEDIPILIGKLDEGYDLVYGAPCRQQQGAGRYLASQIVRLVVQTAMGIAYAGDISAFRAFRTQLREAFADYRAPTVSIDVLLNWGATQVCAATVQHNPRFSGRSGYSVRRLFAHCFNILTGFSTLPLRLASWIGFCLTIFGIGVLIYVVGRYFMLGYSFPGFPFLASIITIFSGAQLFALGIIGEYLARMHLRLMDRPSYVVRQEIEHA